MTDVATATGQAFMAVWREPYHETVLAYCGLVQQRRIDALERRAERVSGAFLVNAAVLNTKALQAEQRALLAALRQGATESRPSDEELLASLADWNNVMRERPVS